MKQSVTLQELRVECGFPADEATEEFVRRASRGEQRAPDQAQGRPATRRSVGHRTGSSWRR